MIKICSCWSESINGVNIAYLLEQLKNGGKVGVVGLLVFLEWVRGELRVQVVVKVRCTV